MKYKAGDKVLIKSIDWYNENKDSLGNIDAAFFDELRSRFCGSIQTIANEGHILGSGVTVYAIEDAYEFIGEESIEGLVEEKALKQHEVPTGSVKIWGLPNGYIFKDENGNIINANKIVLEKKKKEYPKTYEECCEIVGFGLKWDNPFRINRDTHPYMKHLDKLMRSLCKLLICRDAYWKIEGDRKPDNDSGVDKFGICTYDGVVQKSNAVSHWERHLNKVLEFPTKEMRDAFYENFKDLIEECKELL